MYDMVLPFFSDILSSVFCIFVGNVSGTGFVFRLDAQQIVVVTCRHMFSDASVDGGIVHFGFGRYDGEIDDFSGRLLCPRACQDDICAIVVENDSFSCAVCFDNISVPGRVVIGDEIFVLGFPFIMRSRTFRPEPLFVGDVMYPQAILRHGYISASRISDKSSHRMLLDLHNNPGFSGSPIIKKVRLLGSEDARFIPVGTVCGYYYDKIDGKLETDTNSDFAYGCPFDIILRRIMDYKVHACNIE